MWVAGRGARTVAAGAAAIALGCGRLGYDAVAMPDAPDDVAADGGSPADGAERFSRTVLCTVAGVGATRYATVFGGNNRGAGDLAAPIGLDNFFAPQPRDRGQPTRFSPGLTPFVVPHDERTLVWNVLGGTATTGGPAPTCDVDRQNGVTYVGHDGVRLLLP